MFSIVQIDRRIAEAIEPLGTKTKFWYTGGDGRRMLFKAEERGTGDDWAEKVACQIAALLGLPHVHYDLAIEIEGQTPGVVCASLLGVDESLAHGNQLLVAADASYPATQRFRVAEHTINAVTQVVTSLRPPAPGWNAGLPPGVASAAEVFAGYLMLDALIANQDRHHENWGAVRTPTGQLSLAPTFDHGASLARNVSDEERQERLTSKDKNRQVVAFARRARSALHEAPTDKRALTTVAAWMAFSRTVPAAAAAWLDRLQQVDEDAFSAILDQIPPQRMSATCRQFTLYLLNENRKRLLDGDPQ